MFCQIHFHGEDRSSLLSHIDSKFVPTQYGGDMYLPSDQGIELHRLLSLYEDKYRSKFSFTNVITTIYVYLTICIEKKTQNLCMLLKYNHYKVVQRFEVSDMKINDVFFSEQCYKIFNFISSSKNVSFW